MPAIVVAVHSDSCVNLQVFVDGGAPLWLFSCRYRDGDAPGGDYWEWPSRS